ncbi:SDR family NAD(P)-dependent oxidoreductase [Actinophytocola oryzae]|uniref:Short-subunit dehydrogenase n=1 Tax=Actinophytocola oryzae TaxID=502181 RepID=A0A4R7V359_9PSEU|nr:SDR family oxidoreductase [Actinophytocola oryzae]TDV43114.1 short-subunit dehydrogenase [Actinophytocola oryzae]
MSTRTALVTGATAGIGRAVALRLAADGLHVVAHGRDPERGAKLTKEITASGGTARFLTADLANADEVTALARAAGEVDVLVNNAGIYALTSTPDTTVESFDRHFAVNTRAPFLLVGALAPAMAERGHGAIVNITASSATSPAPVGAAYGASKAAMELLTRSWAAEFGARGVRVNGVSPGPVRTAGTSALFGEAIEAVGQANLRSRIGEPEEIAGIVRFLVDDDSSYVNGTVVLANGGVRSAMPAA